MTSTRFFLEYVQQRFRDAAVLTLPFALIGVGAAVWWNPGARAEDLALVVGIPVGLVALSGKVLIMRNPRLALSQKVTLDRVMWKSLSKFGLLMAVVVGAMCIMLGGAFGVSIPLYVALGLEWAVGFGLAASLALFLLGIGIIVSGALVMIPGFLGVIVRAFVAVVTRPADEAREVLSKEINSRRI